MLSLIFLSLYGLYCFFRVDRSKSVVWMGVNVAFLVAMGALSFFEQNVYFGLGVVAAITTLCVSLFVKKVPLTSNLWSYGKSLLSTVLFWPVSLFEDAYTYLVSKL